MARLDLVRQCIISSQPQKTFPSFILINESNASEFQLSVNKYSLVMITFLLCTCRNHYTLLVFLANKIMK